MGFCASYNRGKSLIINPLVVDEDRMASTMESDDTSEMEESMTDTYDYEVPGSRLLTLGDVRGQQTWHDYAALGLTEEDIPELIRMALDDDLNYAGPDNVELWAPLHAWRALGQLHAVEAAEPLLELFDVLDDGINDWNSEDLPKAYGLIGPGAIPPLREYLADATHGMWPRVAAALSLTEIGKRHPDARDEIIAILSEQLDHFAEQDRGFNANLAADLVVDLKAVEAAPVLERAYAADAVDLTMQGDWEDVQIKLGLLDERLTPKPDYFALEMPEYAETMQQLRSRFKQIAHSDESKPHPKPERKPGTQPGRNDPCWCGSGKKYKHCHWREDRKR